SKNDHPPALYEGYRSTAHRSPQRKPIKIEHTLTEVTGPLFKNEKINPSESDLSIVDGQEAQGQRIYVGGKVLDEDGNPV
ncbi:MAG: protocatechuate 3,4-dioxygenase subunit beta, partial [Rhodospirillales bacterium]